MSRVNNGRWMLVMFAAASLVVPGVVAASRAPVVAATPAGAPSVEAIPGDLVLAAEPASAGSCFNTTCTSTLQCQIRCDDPSAKCAPASLPPHYKFCYLP